MSMHRTTVVKDRQPAGEALRKDMRPALRSPFRSLRKSPGGTRCTGCGLVYRDGRWTRGGDGRKLRRPGICPACRRIREGCPAGILKMSTLRKVQRAAVLRRIDRVARRAESEHPLERIMRLDQDHGRLVVYATDSHLIARLGKALRNDLGGSLDLRFGEDEFLLARWTPPAERLDRE